MSDHERFLMLLESHRRPLLKVCWTYGRTSHDRDDLLQEILGRLWASFDRYDRNRSFSTWMYRVALNVAIDFQRRRRRWSREALSLDQNDGGPAVALALASASSQDDSAKRRRLDELWDLLDRQSDSDRALLLLHLENRSHGEIGEILGMSESNIGTRLSRLKKSLRQSALRFSDE